MDSENLRQRVLERATGFMEIFSSPRLFVAVILLLAISGTGGCGFYSTQLKQGSNRPVETGMEVFAQAAIERHTMDCICVFPFNARPEIAAASPPITSAFEARLVQMHPFKSVKRLPYEVKTDSEAIWYARSEGCELAMLSSLLYLMDGTGAMPTKLVVHTRILDARSCSVLWDLKQSACSNPGPDVDLCWNTFQGDPAQRCMVMGDLLAQGFVGYLVQPLMEKQK